MRRPVFFIGGAALLCVLAAPPTPVGRGQSPAVAAPAPTGGSDVGGGPYTTPDGTLKKAILLIPRTYNDGSRVPPEVLDRIYEELFALSGGHTSAGPVAGSYRMRDGTKQTDVLEQVWVAYRAADRPRLRELVARLGSLLGQESMYLEFTDSVIELVPSPHPGRRFVEHGQ